MATLTLKKKAPILGKQLSQLHGKFAVMRQHENFKSMRFTCFQDSQPEAKAEAERLLADKTHQDARYLVVQIIDHAGL